MSTGVSPSATPTTPAPAAGGKPIDVQLVDNGRDLVDLVFALAPSVAAALVSAIAVYAVYRLSARDQDLRDRRVKSNEQLERTRESVVRVVDSTRGFTRRSADLDDAKNNLFDAQGAFTHALAGFAAREVEDHPDVARWAMAQARELSSQVSQLLIIDGRDDFLREQEVLRPDRFAGAVAATLMRWARDGFPTPFDETLSKTFWDF